jgi:hypothetical protein
MTSCITSRSALAFTLLQCSITVTACTLSSDIGASSNVQDDVISFISCEAHNYGQGLGYFRTPLPPILSYMWSLHAPFLRTLYDTVVSHIYSNPQSTIMQYLLQEKQVQKNIYPIDSYK